VTRIRVRRNGALQVEGEFELLDADGNPIARPAGSRILLCRCGHSRCRPFCDGSHNRIRFDVDEVVAEKS